MKRIKILFKLFLVLLLLLSLPLFTLAHSGRTDSQGGHYNRKTGEYHYHGAPKKSYSTETKIKLDNPPDDKTVSSDSANVDSTQDKKEETVYITRTGKKYHREGCRYLKSNIPLDKKEAIQRGYEACSVCNP